MKLDLARHDDFSMRHVGPTPSSASDVARFNDWPFSYTFPFSISAIPGFGVIRSQAVEDGFRSVDRKFFVPQVSAVFLKVLGDSGYTSSP